MKQKASVKGTVRIQVFEAGRIVQERKIENLVTNAGLAHMAGLLNGEQTTELKYIALGTGNTPSDVADVEMEEEVTTGGGARALGTTSLTTTTVEDDTATIVAEFDITVDLDLTELGIFSAASAGVMGSHVTFSVVAVANGQTLVITWNYQVTAP